MGKVKNLRMTPDDILEMLKESSGAIVNLLIIAQGEDGTHVFFNDMDLGQLSFLHRYMGLELDEYIKDFARSGDS